VTRQGKGGRRPRAPMTCNTRNCETFKALTALPASAGTRRELDIIVTIDGGTCKLERKLPDHTSHALSFGIMYLDVIHLLTKR